MVPRVSVIERRGSAVYVYMYMYMNMNSTHTVTHVITHMCYLVASYTMCADNHDKKILLSIPFIGTLYIHVVLYIVTYM